MSDPYINSWRKRRWDYTMLHNAMGADKKYGRDIPNDGTYVTMEFLRNMCEEQKSICAYCQNEMVFGEQVSRTEPSGLSLQRINEDLSHLKTNCIMVCMMCNSIAKAVPHSLMLEHGANFRQRLLRYCADLEHSGDRVLAPENFHKKGKAKCKDCKNRLHRLYRKQTGKK